MARVPLIDGRERPPLGLALVCVGCHLSDYGIYLCFGANSQSSCGERASILDIGFLCLSACARFPWNVKVTKNIDSNTTDISHTSGSGLSQK